MTGIKICGINTAESYAATAEADYAGFVFYPPSPRYVTKEQARDIISSAPRCAACVGVFVNETAEAVADIAVTSGLDAVQLHSNEDTDYIRELRKHLPRHMRIMKAASVSTGDDVARALSFAPHVDMLLLDAKPPKNALLPGGNGVRFDWNILRGRDFPLPWFLAGGIGKDNIEDAVRLTAAPFVDVSSAVEDAPGKKNTQAIRDIIIKARALL